MDEMKEFEGSGEGSVVGRESSVEVRSSVRMQRPLITALALGARDLACVSTVLYLTYRSALLATTPWGLSEASGGFQKKRSINLSARHYYIN
jgi:hypothetical protein